MGVITNPLASLADLFESNLEWASMVARNVHRKVPPSFDVEDLEQEARIAMWRCCEKYDPFNSKGVPFQAYSYLAVRGACLMYCRRRAWREATHESINPSFAWKICGVCQR